MDLVSAMEATAAPTATAEDGKSKCSPAEGQTSNQVLRQSTEYANKPSFYSCHHCHGQGSKQCTTCRGKQQLLVYINLTVTWCQAYFVAFIRSKCEIVVELTV